MLPYSGDTWHDNPTFVDLEHQEHRHLEAMTDLRQKLSTATLCQTEPRSTDIVRIGSIVRVAWIYGDSPDTDEEIWEVVGYGEGDTQQQRITYVSPLVQTLEGLRPGENRALTTPNGEVQIKVLALYSDWASAEQA